MAVRRILREIPRAVLAITSLFGVLLIVYSQLAPVGRAPDEAGHVDLVLRVRTGGGYPAYDGHHTTVGVVAAWAAYAPGFENLYDPEDRSIWLLSEDAPARSSRRTYQEWGGSESTPVLLQLPQHPSLYYEVSAAALGAIEWLTPGTGPAPLDRTWHILRLLSAAMVLPLPMLCWAGMRRLGASGHAATAAAMVPLCIPQLVHIAASVNNDNLLVLLSAVDAVLLAGVLRGDHRRSTTLAIGVVTGLALLTKAFALTLLPWIAVVYAYRFRVDRHGRRSTARDLAIVGASAAAIGGWWYLRNLIRHGHPSPSTLDAAFEQAPRGFEPDTASYVQHFATTIIQRFWGDLGYYEVAVPTALVITASSIFAGAAVAAFHATCSTDDDPPSSPSTGMLAAMGSLVVLLVGLVFVRAHVLYRSSGTFPFIQGRYLFSAIVPMAVVVGFGAAHAVRRWAAPALLGLAGAMHLGTGIRALEGWWAEPDASLGRSVDAMVAWSPWPTAMSLALAISLVATALMAAAALLGAARRPSA